MSVNGITDQANSHQRVVKSAADLYDVQPYYQRFNQKNNMTRQRFWNPPAIKLFQQLNENLKRNIQSNRPGYRLRDWAFYVGSTGNLTASGFGINAPNRRGKTSLPG